MARRKAPLQPPLLAVEVNQGWRYFDGDVPVDAPAGRTLVRVSALDYAAPADGATRSLADQGKRLARARVVWLRYGKWACFTAEAHRGLAGCPVSPVTGLALDAIQRQTPGCVLRLPLVGGLLALAVYRKNQEVSGWTVVREEDVQASADRLIQDAGLGEAPVMRLPAVGELSGMRAGGPLKTYPLEAEWNGIKLRTIRSAAAAGAMSLAGLGLLDGVAALHQRSTARADAASAQQRLQITRRRVSAWNRRHVNYDAHSDALDFGRIVEAARRLALPGGSVQLDKDGSRLIVYLPKVDFPNLVQGQWVNPDSLRSAMARTPPKGWRLQGLTAAGAAGGYALIYLAQPEAIHVRS